jgi:biuret amidohydrolase
VPTQPLIVGNPVLVVVDIQQGGGMPAAEVGIPHMAGHADRVQRAEKLVAAARVAGVPVVFFQEVHRPSGVDFGRELDGTEGVHCVEGQPGTDLEPSLRPLASLGEGEAHDQTKFGFQAAVSAALVNWFRRWSSWRQACASSLR